MLVRPMTAADLPAIKAIVAAVDLFPPDMLNDMTASALRDADPDEVWHVAERDGAPVGIAYHVPERMTEGTYNLLLIAVHPAAQRSGTGAALMRAVEDRLAGECARLCWSRHRACPISPPPDASTQASAIGRKHESATSTNPARTRSSSRSSSAAEESVRHRRFVRARTAPSTGAIAPARLPVS